jgi:FkbM family methyltransferase
MTFWDIGAHIGEYSLLASQWVGSSGHVEAFEPQPEIFEFLSRNVAENKLTNVALHRLAISERDGCRRMSVHAEPSQSFLSPANVTADLMPSIEVPTASIDEILKSHGRVPNVLKVDAEGAEKMILDGAITLLELSEAVAPIWVIEFEPDTCVRFGYHPGELVSKLIHFGYTTYWVLPKGDLLETSHSSSYPLRRTIIASKRPLPC